MSAWDDPAVRAVLEEADLSVRVRRWMSADDPVEIMARHADYVSDFVRHCTCGEWSDTRPEAQGTRVPFIHHVLAQLALHGYALELPRT